MPRGRHEERAGSARARGHGRETPRRERAKPVLVPPPGLEANLLELQGQELLVIRVPLVRSEPSKALSPAEREVADLALKGLSNLEIGERRGTSERTVANQVATIFRKLGVGSRKELALRLLRERSQ